MSDKFCPVCGKKIEIKNYHDKKKIFCSIECKNSEHGKKILVEKRKQTCLKKYGVENPNQVKDFQEKAKQTNLKKYGYKIPTQSIEVREKIKQTWLEKYNQEEGMRVKEKRKQIYMEKYGVENPFQFEIFKEKSKQTWLKKYGTDNPSKSNEIKQKIFEIRRKQRFDIFKKKLKNRNISPLFDFEKYMSIKSGDEIFFKCDDCGKTFKFKVDKSMLEVRKIRCPNRIHWSNVSHAECQITDWLSTLDVLIIRNNKKWGIYGKQFEADIYLPDYKLAIEYNGLYWHSNLNKDKNYHFNKWKYFKELGIECIQIFENEWKEKKEIVKSIILNKLGKNKRIFARKCSVKEIPNDEYELFLEQNHIQGYHQAKVRLGLYFENELVELMSFSKPRFNKKYDWENIRTCTKIGYHVIGGFSKLLKYFRKKYGGSIISYIDSRYFNGKGYLKNGFQNVGHSNPNYFYFKHNSLDLYSRNSFQKHKLKDKLEIYDENLTEQENMVLNNFEWIYDCGNDILDIF